MSASMPEPALDSETSALFNPAFCAVLLNRATRDFETKSGEAMPVTLAFLILPSALHKPTRDELPSRTSASMWAWLRSHPVLLMDFGDRVRAFRPFTAEAIAYALQHGVLEGQLGLIASGALGRRPRTLHPTEDWLSCLRAAGFLGKWFGGVDADEATVLAQWGVRP